MVVDGLYCAEKQWPVLLEVVRCQKALMRDNDAWSASIRSPWRKPDLPNAFSAFHLLQSAHHFLLLVAITGSYFLSPMMLVRTDFRGQSFRRPFLLPGFLVGGSMESFFVRYLFTGTTSALPR